MLVPKTHTQIQIPPPVLTRVEGMRRLQKKAGKLSQGKRGANYPPLKDMALEKKIFFLIQNIYFLRGSEFQYQNMANTEGRLFSSLLDIFS